VINLSSYLPLLSRLLLVLRKLDVQMVNITLGIILAELAPKMIIVLIVLRFRRPGISSVSAVMILSLWCLMRVKELASV